MNNLQVVDSREVLGFEFKIYGDFENPLFLAKDIAKLLEIKNHRDMISNIDEEEKVVGLIDTPGGKQNTTYLTEDGLYEALMQSRKPIAKEFKKKVKEILKELRKGNKLIVDSNSSISEMINAMMPTLIQNTIQSTMLAMNTVLEKHSENMLKRIDTAEKEYVNAKNIITEQEIKHEEQLKATRELIGFKTKNTFGVSNLLKTRISDIKGYTIRANEDYHYQLAKQRLFAKYGVHKWEDLPIDRYNEIHADIDSLEDIDSLYIK